MTSSSRACALLLVCVVAVAKGGHIGTNPFDPANDPMGFHRCFADIVFVLDGSGSVGANSWQVMLDFVKNFTYRLHYSELQNQVAVVSFSNEAHVHLTLLQSRTMSHAERNRTIDAIPWLDQWTNTASALRTVRTDVFTAEAGDRDGFANIVILLSDGKPTREENDTIPEANALKLHREGTKIFTIGIGDEGISYPELVEMASRPESVFVKRVMSFSLLNTILNDIVDNVCKVTSECSGKDLAFVLDSSGSVGMGNFLRIKDFVKAFMERVPLGPGAEDNQVGLVTYSTTAELHARLDDVTNMMDFNDLVDSLMHANQRTNISGAITEAMQGVFDAQLPHRHSNPDVMLLITDGHDNTNEGLMFEAAMQAKDAGVRIFPIGIGPRANMSNMLRIASAPGFFHTYILDDFDTLVSMATPGGESIYDLVCAPQHSYPPPYFSVSTAECVNDIYIVMDASSSISPYRFAALLVTLASALQHADTDLDVTSRRVTVITYGNSEAMVNVPFGDYTTVAQLADKVRALSYVGGTPQLWTALRSARTLISQQTDPDVTSQVFVLAAGLGNTTKLQMEVAAIHNLEHKVLIYAIALESEVGYSLSNYLLVPGQTPERFSYVIPNTENTVRALAELSNTHAQFLSALFARSCIDTAKTMWMCDFEEPSVNDENMVSTMCDAFYDDSSDNAVSFTMRSGNTPSRNTGPSHAFTLPYYLHLEATGKTAGDKAVLVLPRIEVDASACLHFLRHMFGFHIGTLRVLVRTTYYDEPSPSGDGPTVKERVAWMTNGPQGEDWIYTTVQLHLHEGEEVVLEAMRAYGYSGDIAVDSLTLQHGPCSVTEYATSLLMQYSLNVM